MAVVGVGCSGMGRRSTPRGKTVDLGRHLTPGLHHGKASDEPGEGSRACKGVREGADGEGGGTETILSWQPPEKCLMLPRVD